jgi:integrase/recombinase XerD
MVEATEIQGYSSKYRNQRDKLADADIDDRDSEAIAAYLDGRDANDEVGTGTLADHCNRLRLSAERADVPLVDMDLSDCEAFLVSLKRERGLSEGTRRNYRKALRKFFEHREADWWREVNVGASPDREVDDEKVLSMDEINDLLDAATHPRRKALIALLADTGMRISAAAGLRIRDYSVDGRLATVQPNPDSPNKDARDPIPLTWSRGSLCNWLDAHPASDNPDAPLFIKVEHVDEDDDISDRFLSYQYLTRRIKRVADDADIDRNRLNAHNFRHSAISRWIREGMSEQQIKHRVHWAEDSGQFDVYSAVTAEEMNDDILGHYGLSDEEDRSVEIDACPTCDTPLAGGETFCPGCGSPMSAIAADNLDAAERDLTDAIRDAADDPEELTALADLLDAIQSDPEIAARIAD